MIGDPRDSTEEDTGPGVGEAMLAKARELLPALQGVEVGSTHVAYR